MSAQRGFTLLELLAAMSVAAILVGIAISNFTILINNDRETTQVNNLIYTLNYARSEAVKEDNPVCVCASSDGINCGTNWASGWMIFTTPSASIYTPNLCTGGPSSLATSTFTSSILQSVQALPSTMTLITKNPATWTASSVSTLQFQPTGLINSATTVAFNFCDKRGATKATDVEVLITGRSQSSHVQGYAVNGTTALTCP